MTHAGGRPPIFKTVQELEDCIETYKEYLRTENKPPTIAGLAYYTGIDRKTLYNYKAKDQYFHTIKKFVDWIIMNFEEIATDKGNAGVIFLMKNYGYTDKQIVESHGEQKITIQLPEDLNDD